jgi:hypothetical protein
MANFAAADLDGLVRIVKRKLKKIQYRPHLIDGCLAGTGLKLNPGNNMRCELTRVRRPRQRWAQPAYSVDGTRLTRHPSRSAPNVMTSPGRPASKPSEGVRCFG